MKRAFVEIDEVIVPDSLITLARAGSNDARHRLKATVGSAILSHRPAELQDDDAIVSVRELRQLGVIQKLIVYA